LFEDTFSSVSFESILFYAIASCLWTFVNLLDLHKTEVDEQILNRKTHTSSWYRNLALAYRHGYDLISDSDQYADEVVSNQDAAIVSYAAVTRSTDGLIIKIAKGGDVLGKLSSEEYGGFQEYILRCADAGVKIKIISVDADRLKLVVDVFYNPMVLDSEGKRLDGSNETPLSDAITAYLQNLPFDGDFTLTDLTDALQDVEGVEVPRVLLAETQWGNYEWQSIESQYRAEAGWLKIYDAETDLTIIYHANISE
jgi:hypothetical protein